MSNFQGFRGITLVNKFSYSDNSFANREFIIKGVKKCKKHNDKGSHYEDFNKKYYK